MTVGHKIKKPVYIVAAKRTPFGTFGGALKDLTPVDLQVHACKAALESIDLDPSNVDSVVIGNALTLNTPDTPYIARHVGLRIGCKLDTPCLTINRLCGSGFQSIINGYHEMLLGDSEIVVTGGSDNMSTTPFALKNVRFGLKLGQDPVVYDMLWASLTDPLCKTPLGGTAENLGAEYGLTKEEVDEFALRSQQTWAKAHEAGLFNDEIAPIEVKGRKGMTLMSVDEHPKPSTTMEVLRKLPTVFKKDGLVTAGSSSGICDGASCIIIATEEAVKKHGFKPLAKVLGYGISGCEPTTMGYGPVPAIRAMLEKTGHSLDEIEQIEINEAFGAQAVSCMKELKVPVEKVNTCGGAIAIGHPLAASGSRIMGHLAYKLRQNNERYGIGSACVAGGQGVAMLIERM